MEKLLEALFTYALTFLLMMLTALFVMVFHGAVADDFGWRTYGYWTYWQALILLWHLGSTASFGVSYSLVKIKETLEKKR